MGAGDRTTPSGGRTDFCNYRWQETVRSTRQRARCKMRSTGRGLTIGCRGLRQAACGDSGYDRRDGRGGLGHVKGRSRPKGPAGYLVQSWGTSLRSELCALPQLGGSYPRVGRIVQQASQPHNKRVCIGLCPHVFNRYVPRSAFPPQTGGLIPRHEPGFNHLSFQVPGPSRASATPGGRLRSPNASFLGAEVVKVARPLLPSVPVPSTTEPLPVPEVPSMKVTVPVGVSAAGDTGTTVAVNTTC